MNLNRFVIGQMSGQKSGQMPGQIARLAGIFLRAATGAMSLVMLFVATATAAPSTFMPPAATRVAGDVDSIYSFLLITSLISFILLIGGMFYFIYKYQRKSANDKTAYITHDYTLEFVWSFVPFLIFMFVFFWGWKVYHDMRHAPEGALEVQVMAKKWDWRFIYKSGKVAMSGIDDNGQRLPATLVVPVGRPVKLIMASEKISEGSTDPLDRPVLHSFYIPAARIKQDLVPGRFTMLWFNFDQPGDYWVFCAEFCGAGHSSMRGLIRAVPEAEFDKWLSAESGGKLSLADQGRALYAAKACVGCHSADGSRVVGPSFKHLWGSKHVVEGGATVTVDENYVRESILNPNAKIVQGFPSGVMPVFAGQITDDEISALIEFIKTLK
ncbi:cytochrome c oxidase subunit II [soil metagenome]